MADSSNDGDRRSWLYHPGFPPDWSKGPLYPLATWINGMAFRDINFSDTGRPVIKIAEIKNGITAQTKFTEAAYDESYFITAGDMLFSWSGQPETSIDVLWWRGPDGWLNQHIFKVLPNNDLCLPEFFYYILRYLKPNFVAIARNKQTTGLGHVAKRDLEAIEVAWPPKPLQQAIAYILGTLDDKIELNRRMNQTLEATARAIFKSWFVDFDPVRARAAGEQPPSLAPHIADLFPDAFEESELGEIPKRWRVKPLDRIANYQNGLALQRYPPEGDEFLPVIKIRELRQGSSDERSGKASLDIREDCIIEDGDIIFSWSGSLLVDIWCGGRGALNQHLFKVTSTRYPRWFYYHWTRHHLAEFQRIAAGKATTMGHIKRNHLSEALVAVPPDEVLEASSEIIGQLIQSIVSHNLQSRTLAELRDTLVPKLISGELRVPDAERIVGRHV